MNDPIRPMSWNGRRVLITGAAGFLGSWVTRVFLQAGAEVAAVVRRPPRPDGLFTQFTSTDRVTVLIGSTLDLDFLKTAFDPEPFVVIHAAAQAYMPMARVIPHETFESNVRGTWNVLEAIRQCGARVPIVLCSSDCVYGETDGTVCTEDTPRRGGGPYEVSKICAEQVAGSFARAFGIPVGIARCSNLYGEGDRELSRIIPGTIRSLLHSERPMIRSNGLAIRDYLHVADAAHGVVCLASSLRCNSSNAMPFNFSSERPASVLEIVSMLVRFSSRNDLTPDIQDQTSTTISRKEISSARARQHLGWKPAVALEDGLRRTYAWHRAAETVHAGGN